MATRYAESVKGGCLFDVCCGRTLELTCNQEAGHNHKSPGWFGVR